MKYLSLFVLLALLGCGAGVGRKAAAKPPEPIDRNLLHLAPGGSDAVLLADGRKLRASPLWPSIRSMLENAGRPVFRKPEGPGDFSPLEQVDTLLVAFSGLGGPRAGDAVDPGQVVVVLKGAFKAKEVVAALAAKGGAFEKEAVPWDVSRFPGVKRARLGVLAVTDQTLVISDVPTLARVAAQVDSPELSLAENPAFKDLSADGPYAAQLRYRRAPGQGPVDAPGGGLIDLDLNAMTGLDALLTLGEGLDLGLQVAFENQALAMQFANEFEKFRRSFSVNPLVGALGLGWIFDRISVKTIGSTAAIEAVLGAADIEQLNRLVLEFAKIRDLLKDEGSGALPGPGRFPFAWPEERQKGR